MNLFSAGSDFHLIAEVESGPFEFVDSRRQVVDFENDPIPSARFLVRPVGHRRRHNWG